MNRIERAIVLAAGRGTRLGSLTDHIPKPMVPVCDKPILLRIVEGLTAAGVNRYLFVIGYRGSAIREFFGDGSALSIRIDYVEQPKPSGTGAALLLGRDWARSHDSPGLFVSYGDILTDPVHYRMLRDDFAAQPCAGVIGINPVEDPSAGAAVYRNGPRITRVVEKPPPGTANSKWNISGISVYGPSIWSALSGITPSVRGEIELTDAISTLIRLSDVGEPEVRAVELPGFWSDVGTPQALVEAERACRANDP